MIPCYIAIGSNLNQPQVQLQAAVQAMAGLPDSELRAVSSVYCSAAVGPGTQPDYLNAVAALATSLAPLDLLDALQAIENARGRVRNERWAARTLDLDLLLYGDLRIDERRLKVPHPSMAQRNFVLVPLAEICAPECVLPGGADLGTLLENCQGGRLQRMPIRLEISRESPLEW